LMDYEAVIGPSGSPAPGTVDGTRDLVDFFPVFLNIKELLKVMPPGQQAIYKLKQDSGALNFAYADLKPEEAGSYLTDLTIAQSLRNAETIQIRSAGVELTAEFLNKIKNEGKGVILLEGRDKILVTDNKPLVLAVCNELGETIAETRFQISIDGVEVMFRHKNLLTAGGGSGGPEDRLGEPLNYPDRLCSNKSFVMVHGYNVDPESARGWGAEIFKRLYWSGSKAKYYTVTWYGDEITSGVVPDYHANVDNAFNTAHAMASFLNGLSNVTVAAHSLGNMLIGSAIHDWAANPQNYFMLDAAVALEAFDGNAALEPQMIHPDWDSYSSEVQGTYVKGSRVFACEWYLNPAFVDGDERKKLTWRNRLANVGANVYNFYSSSEDVLRQHNGNPNDGDTIEAALTAGRHAWALQEKLKGRQVDLLFGKCGSAYGGWKLTSNYYVPPEVPHTPSPGEAGNASDSGLTTDPIFDPGYVLRISPPPTQKSIHSGAPNWIIDLTDAANGSSVAGMHKNQLLSEMFPARTLPAGANDLTKLEDKNFNMPALFVTDTSQWPREGIFAGKREWLHGDLKDMAYSHLYKLYNKFVEIAQLRQ
ncbi:MAG TPA: hypothetical protein VIU12_14780, partial [Chryseolinea sp.]